jgi:hypothetical protein
MSDAERRTRLDARHNTDRSLYKYVKVNLDLRVG